MSTRSYVGIIEKDGKVKFGYHHSDSHLESLGIDLFQSIKNKNDVKKVENFTTISDEEMERKEYFDVTNNDIFIEFCYAFDMNDNEWYVSSCHFMDGKEHKLKDIVKDDAQMECYADMYYEEYRESIITKIRENIPSEKDMKMFDEAAKASGDEVCEFLAMVNNDDVDLRDLV